MHFDTLESTVVTLGEVQRELGLPPVHLEVNGGRIIFNNGAETAEGTPEEISLVVCRMLSQATAELERRQLH